MKPKKTKPKPQLAKLEDVPMSTKAWIARETERLKKMGKAV